VSSNSSVVVGAAGVWVGDVVAEGELSAPQPMAVAASAHKSAIVDA
jgi:hypothetical protein